jgi:hypothetical protein
VIVDADQAAADVPVPSALLGRGRQRFYRQLRGMAFYPSQGRYNITVNTDPSFLWFRVAKVGTRTIFAQLRSNGVPAIERHNLHYPVNRFGDHFAFAFVRNPWDRFVSCWTNRVVKQNSYGFDAPTRERMQDLGTFAAHVAEHDLDHGDAHVRRQSQLIDLNRVNSIGRFETFADDLRGVLTHLGLTFDETTHVNRSGRDADYRGYYDDRSAELVGSMYETDVKLFGYTFDPRT